MSEEEQRAWVEAARRGDEMAMERIFSHYQASLYALARHMVRDDDEAEDVVQQTFIKAFRSLPQLREVGSLSLWLRRILWRVGIDTLRSRKRRPESLLEDHLRYRPAAGRGPEAEFLVQSDVAALRRALRRLRERDRAYILLREFDGLSYDEMAEVLGEPLTTVKVALFRARERLRELLRQEAGEDIG